MPAHLRSASEGTARTRKKRKSYADVNRRLVDRYNDWMVAQHYAKETKVYYLKVLYLFCDFLGTKSMAGASHLDVRKFITRASEEGASHDQVYKRLGILRVFYDFLKLGGIVHYVAPRFIRLRVPTWKRPPVFSEREAAKLITAAETPRERALIELFYGSGCRLREVLHLKITDLNFAEKTARVVGKYAKVRDVLLTDGAVEALKVYIGIRERGFIFQPWWAEQNPHLSMLSGRWYGTWRDYRLDRRVKASTKCIGRANSMSRAAAEKKFEAFLKETNRKLPIRDRPLSAVSLSKDIRRVARRAGLRNVCAQMLRRAFATHMYDNGARPEIIQVLLGHECFGTTATYVRLSAGKVEKVFQETHPRGQMNVTKLRQQQPSIIQQQV